MTTRSTSTRWPPLETTLRRWISAGDRHRLVPRHPKPYFEQGDPYHCHCQKTTRLLRERLGWSDKKLITTFQSRFGAQEWLQPYTDKTVERLAREGVKSIAIVNPGFSADCIETLDEIGAKLARVPACRRQEVRPYPLPERQPGRHAGIETLVRRELQGWL